MADTPENVADNTADIVITDRDLYDHAISDAPARQDTTPGAPAAAEDKPLLTPDRPPEQPPQQPVRARDESGRFAPGKPQQQQPQQQQPQDHRVPLTELLNTRERAQRAEAEAQQLRQQWVQLQQQQAAAAQQQQQPQTIWDDPQTYLMQNVVQPLRQEMQTQALREKDAMSREFANHQFGAQPINAALADLARIRQTPQGNVLYWQIMGSGHPYAALVSWHKQARAQQQIGPDPEAWFRQRAQQLLDDPKFQAAAIERARGRAGQQQRGGTANVSLPPSLSSVPASSPRLEEQGDLSSESLYRFATK